MKIILTGASGYIGKELVKHLSLSGHEVLSLSRQTPSGDVIDYEYQITSVADKFDALVHLAGIAHRSGIEAQDYEQSNVQLTKNLADIAHSSGMKHFVFFSTAKVHGEQTAEPINSSSPFSPSDEYSKSKVRAEEYLASIQSNTLMSSIRPPVVYGSEPKANIATIANRIKNKQYIPVSRSPNVRSFVSLTNLCHSVSSILQRAGSGYKGYLVDDRTPRSTEQFILEIAERLKIEPKIVRLPQTLFSTADRLFTVTHGRRMLLPLYGDFNIQCNSLERETGWRAQSDHIS